MNKKEIINYIEEIVGFCIADANTYLYVKCVSSVNKDRKKIDIGGGNFTILLSTLATLEFLGVINVVISGKDEDFFTKEDVEKIENFKKEFEEKYKNDKFIKGVVKNTPEIGDLKDGSGKLLREFLEDEEVFEITGINKKDCGKLQCIRNKLAHEFTPKIIPALSVDFCPGHDFEKLISEQEEESVFSNNEINVNALNARLKKLLIYIVGKLERIEDKSALDKLSRYIENIR
jgi:hypothetical protein